MPENVPLMGEFDVLIAGAGVMGVLTAAALDERGYSCALVEPHGIAADQTGHSHGYLHRGYIYLRAEQALVRNLSRARDRWDALMQPEDVVSASSLVGFTDDVTRAAAVRSWESAGLRCERAGERDLPPAFLRRPALRYLYKTDEPVILAGQLLKRRRARCRSTVDLRGTVHRLQLRRTECTGAIVHIGQPALIRARHVVLAAGAGNAAIINNTIGIYRAASALRTSFMLIMKGRALPRLSVILPESRYYGLFMASRREKDGTGVWLASNFISFGGAVKVTTPICLRWVRDMMGKIATAFDVASTEPQYGVYAGLKAEYRRDPERMPDDRIVETFGMRNLSVSWPTKMTLAPALASALADEIDRKLKHPLHGAVAREELGLRPERWEATPCFSKQTLINNLSQLSVSERWS